MCASLSVGSKLNTLIWCFALLYLLIGHKTWWFYLVIATVIVQQLNWGLFILCMAGLFIITSGSLVESAVGFLVLS